MRKFPKRTQRELASGKIKKVTIACNLKKNTNGRVCYRADFDDRTQIIITLAGNEAQGRFDPASRDRSGGDYDKIKAIMANRDARLARSLVSPKTNPFAGLWACADLSEDELEELADDFFGDQDCEPLDLDSCQRECGRLVRDNWPAIEKLANALLEHETLSGEEIEDLLS